MRCSATTLTAARWQPRNAHRTTPQSSGRTALMAPEARHARGQPAGAPAPQPQTANRKPHTARHARKQPGPYVASQWATAGTGTQFTRGQGCILASRASNRHLLRLPLAVLGHSSNRDLFRGACPSRAWPFTLAVHPEASSLHRGVCMLINATRAPLPSSRWQSY